MQRSLGFLVLSHPTSCVFKTIYKTLQFTCNGVCVIKEARKCVKDLIEAFRSHAFVAMQSIMLEMRSVGQGKLACAIRAELKHLERSYSTLCCSVSDICSFVTPPLCLRWSMLVKGSLPVQ